MTSGAEKQNLRLCDKRPKSLLRGLAEKLKEVGAVVSRDRRPNLAGERLSGVEAPVLSVVGSADHQGLCLDRTAAARPAFHDQRGIVTGTSVVAARSARNF